MTAANTAGSSPGRRPGVRPLALAFTAVAIVLAAGFVVDPGLVPLATAALLGVLGVVSLVLGLRYDERERGRRVLVAGHLGNVLLAFLLSIVAGSSLLLILMGISVATVVALRPRFGRLRPNRRKLAGAACRLLGELARRGTGHAGTQPARGTQL